MTLQENRVIRTFNELRAAGKKTVMPFITAGFPDMATTGAILRQFDTIGVRVCELGFPFTDPVADGPVIQASYTAALESGVTCEGVFDAVRQFRADGGKLALMGMLTYSIVYRHGPKAFAALAAEAGFDGLIIPDLPIDESAEMEQIAADAGLALVLLIAPTTPPARQEQIARRSRGFIYYISVAGITGERTALPAATIDAVARLREHTDTPVCVGFGVSSAKIVSEVCQTADGAIVGSAIVHRMTDSRDRGADEIAATVGQFVSELLEPVQ